MTPGASGACRSSSLSYLHQDEAVLVVLKPPGLLSVPGRGPDKADCVAARVAADHPGALIVHRLDMETSGLMVFARTKAAQRALGIQFQNREVDKLYVAIVGGLVTAEYGEIDLPLLADWPNRPLQKVDIARGKESLTRFRRLATDELGATSRLELEPHTGRSHQLRVHMMALGHPILGDMLYAPPALRAQTARLALHASRLAFSHPDTGQPLCFHSEPPF